jgi:hypothetical protein
MQASIFLVGLLVLTGCTAGQARIIGARIQAIESVACPLTTIRNIERTALTALHLIPFFAQWEAICPETEELDGNP